MATANDIINRSLRIINVLEAGEIPSADMSQDALTTLNAMIDEWQAQSLMIFTRQRIVLDLLTLGTQSFTLGPGGFFNATCPYRPAQIERYGILWLANPSQPLELPLNSDGSNLSDDEWANIVVKAVQSQLPLWVWDDGGYPLRTLNFWPIPNADVQPVIYPWVPLDSFASLTTDVDFPPAYQNCVTFNLAMDLTMEYGGKIPDWLPNRAQMAMAHVKSINIPLDDMVIDPSLTAKGGFYDWRSDQFRVTGPR